MGQFGVAALRTTHIVDRLQRVMRTTLALARLTDFHYWLHDRLQTRTRKAAPKTNTAGQTRRYGVTKLDNRPDSVKPVNWAVNWACQASGERVGGGGAPRILLSMRNLRALIFRRKCSFPNDLANQRAFSGEFSGHAGGLKFLKMSLPFRTNRIGVKISRVPMFLISA